jgi:hypothetical protein
MSTASFRDRVKLELLGNNLIESQPLILLLIKNDAGMPLFGQCFRYDGLSGAYLGEPTFVGYLPNPRYGNIEGQFFSYGGEFGQRSNLQSADLSIFGDFKDDITLTIDLPPNIALERLGSMNKTEITVVRGSSCK